MDIHRLLTGLWAGGYLDDTAHPWPIDLSFSVKMRGLFVETDSIRSPVWYASEPLPPSASADK